MDARGAAEGAAGRTCGNEGTATRTRGAAEKDEDKDVDEDLVAQRKKMAAQAREGQKRAPTAAPPRDDGKEEEVFRKVWKHFKRTKHEVTAYVKRMDEARETGEPRESGQKRKRVKDEIDLLDFDHLENSPKTLTDLVTEIKVQRTEATTDAEAEFRIDKAYGIEGRPGFIFVPNPFVSSQIEAKWVERLAIEYASSDVSERNRTQEGEQPALGSKLRWATLGYHYDWDNRRYTEDRQSPFPSALASLAKRLVEPFAMNIVPETAIINYYRAGTTMGGHKDDAEWTDDAPVVSISFGNAGVYVLGGDSQTDASPPGPVPLVVRNGDVVILGGPSRMNIHGVPCMMKGTLPKRLVPNLAPALATYLEAGRINVNVRQVKPRPSASAQATQAALGVLRRVPK